MEGEYRKEKLIRLAEKGAAWAQNTFSHHLQELKNEANISSLIILHNQRQQSLENSTKEKQKTDKSFQNTIELVKKDLENRMEKIIHSINEEEAEINADFLKKSIQDIYPEFKIKTPEKIHTPYEPYTKMISLAIMAEYCKKISLTAYEGPWTLFNAIKLRNELKEYNCQCVKQREKTIQRLIKYSKIT